ncbi:MAG TPA: bifunctional diaminohydroxyphosphoribosylaminopyrimidine deaminase/5-amino-6-(5-phosphoribosylamino)uracil reductase RibD [Dehalococcoidales bacterium]
MDYMELALSLARLAQGQVSPNPAVGAVIVKNDAILGQGYTQPPGGDHAEIVALKQAGREARGATLYITLEPHCHQGRTPPCTRAIIDAGIAEVHFAVIDPNPQVAGKGHAELQKAGIKVYLGERAEEASEINEAFNKYILTGLPFVTVKFASSLDGKIATRAGESKWITGAAARKHVQHLRYVSDAVMTGANTVIIDDPRLTIRLAVKGGVTHKQPLRIIIDGQGRTPRQARLFKEPGRTLLVVANTVTPEVKRNLKETGAELLEMPADNGVIDLAELLKVLGSREITSILVEAGGILLGSLFDRGLVDKVIALMAPIIIGGEEARPSVAGRGVEKLSDCARLKRVRVERVGEDVMVVGYVSK